MISKTTQLTLQNWPSNNSPYDAKFIKRGDSIPLHSSVMAFACCFCSLGKGDIRLAAVLLKE